MDTSKPSPAIRVDGDSTSRRHSRAISTPDTTPVRRRPSIAARSDSHSQGAPASSQDVSSSRYSTSQPSRPNSVHDATDTKDGKGIPKTPTSLTPTNSGLDPLSTHIYHRTNSNTEPSIAQRLRNSGRPDSPAAENGKQNAEQVKPSNALLDIGRERRKGTSFLSRLSMRGGWKKEEETHDSDSELGDLRTDGTYARALTSVMGAGGGFIPLYKEPPRYIRVKAHNKKTRDFNHMFLAQELMGSRNKSEQPQGRAPATAVGSKLLKGGDAIWAAEFSIDGRYLAVAGKDHVVRIFAVISTPEERKAHEEEEAQGEGDGEGERLSAPVFRSKPVREFRGHTGEVLALSWSKNNFLLSSSMDKTVRLWHMSRPECLSTFAHKDVVTSISFHPNDDRFFLAGSLDSHLRLWSIPDKNVAFQAATGEFITAVAFTPDGKIAICGVLSGMCSFYATEGLKLKYQIHVRSSRGKNAKGSKITGIRTLKVPSGPEAGVIKVLISSNDSRIRVYNLNDKVVQAKYKGLENQSSQIHARFSDDASFIVCGSEDRKAYIWKLGSDDNDLRDKQPYESFDAHPEVVTTALIAPTATRQLLSASGDPIYDLCNPPPVTLRSLDETNMSQTALSEEDGSVGPKKPEESPAYIERSNHFDGNIIVTTDRTGKIKVFRQDCAYAKRQQGLWETGSKFSGRIAGVGRSGSIMTRTSAGSRIHSRRGSLSMNGSNPVQLQQASDIINSWRQDVDGKRSSWNGTPVRGDRSQSPTKTGRSPLNTSAANIASEARRQPYTSSPIVRGQNPASPTSSVASNFTTVRSTKGRESSISIAAPPTPSFSLISADSDGKGEKADGSFWNLNRWRGGLPGLRNSTSFSTGGPNGADQGSSSPGGHARSGSEYLTPRKTPGRMSLGINGLDRTRNEDMVNRRRSVGPTMGSGMSPKDRQITRESTVAGTKRVDSGVRMSAESNDSVLDSHY